MKKKYVWEVETRANEMLWNTFFVIAKDFGEAFDEALNIMGSLEEEEKRELDITSISRKGTCYK